MKPLAVTFIILSTVFTAPQPRAEQDVFESFLWQNRLLLIFSPRLEDSRLQRQNDILREAGEGLADRHMRIIRLVPGKPVSVDGIAMPTTISDDVFRDFDIEADQFALVLVGKDGNMKMKRATPQNTRPIFDLIDTMPMRQLEMQQQSTPDN